MINLVSVFVAAIAANILGFFWYSPVMFGKKWIALNGINEGEVPAAKKQSVAKTYAISFMATLVTAYVLALVIYLTQASTVFGGAMVGFWAWLGFVATLTANSVLFEKKSWGLWLLNNGYNLLSLALMGAILAVWG